MSFAIACFIIVPSETFAKTPSSGVLHSIIVADTKDVSIGASCTSDARRLKRSLQAISSQLLLRPRITILDRNKCRGKDLGKWLSKLRPSSKDVIMVFYAGHGYGDRTGDPLPILSLRDGEMRGTALQSVIEQFPCRFSFVLFDCCNSFLEEGLTRGNHFHPIIHKGRTVEKLKPLFRGKAAITVCAALRGEDSWGENSGGYLTTGFLRALKAPKKKTIVSWEQILTKARRYSAKRSHNQQHAFYTIKAR